VLRRRHDKELSLRRLEIAGGVVVVFVVDVDVSVDVTVVVSVDVTVDVGVDVIVVIVVVKVTNEVDRLPSLSFSSINETLLRLSVTLSICWSSECSRLKGAPLRAHRLPFQALTNSVLINATGVTKPMQA